LVHVIPLAQSALPRHRFSHDDIAGPLAPAMP
jgi:hypothetical protein